MDNRARAPFRTRVPAAPAPFAPLSRARAGLGESPVWSPIHSAYWWVDIQGCKLFRTAPDGATQEWATPEIPGFVQCIGQTVFVGMQSGIFAFDPDRGPFTRRVALKSGGVRFNDACTDTRGRIWAGTMDLENRSDNGVLYLFDPATGALDPRLDGFRTINGLAWDDNAGRLFLSDSHPSVQSVWTCTAAPDGALPTRTLFARFDALQGRPDGAALDRTRHYWIAGVGGATLYRFAPTGALVARYAVPVKSPTKPALGPDDGAGPRLVLTSFADDGLGGRLLIWRDPPPTPDPESDPHDETPR